MSVKKHRIHVIFLSGRRGLTYKLKREPKGQTADMHIRIRIRRAIIGK